MTLLSGDLSFIVRSQISQQNEYYGISSLDRLDFTIRMAPHTKDKIPSTASPAPTIIRGSTKQNTTVTLNPPCIELLSYFGNQLY